MNSVNRFHCSLKFPDCPVSLPKILQRRTPISLTNIIFTLLSNTFRTCNRTGLRRKVYRCRHAVRDGEEHKNLGCWLFDGASHFNYFARFRDDGFARKGRQRLCTGRTQWGTVERRSRGSLPSPGIMFYGCDQP